jgi:RNA polymerase sigma factor (sigma-70 family)
LVNEFATGWRRRWRGERPTAVLPERAGADHTDGVMQHAMLMAVLAQLPPRQRAVIVLRFFHDYTEVRTAQTLGITVGTVKSQTAKALATLRVSDGLGDEMPPAPLAHHGEVPS